MQQEHLTILQPELHHGERVLWSGAPIPGRAFIGATAIYFFAIPWTAFSLFWEAMALSVWFAPRRDGQEIGAAMTGMAVVFPIFGLPFVLIGLGMMAAPFFAAYEARRSVYAVTTKRAIILTQGFRKSFQTFPLAGMGQALERKERRDGSGHLFFHFKTKRDSDGDNYTDRIGFKNIPGVKEAETRLTEAIERAKEAS